MNPTRNPTVLILLFLFCSLSSSYSMAKDTPNVGQVAPDFSITQMDGTEFKLSDYRYKQPVYLVFWTTWCTYCMKKIPKLKDAQANLSDQIKVIAVNTSLKDSVEKSIKFQEKFEINYPLAFDHDKRVTDLYGVWGTPTEFIIDIDGIIRYRDGVPSELRPNLADWNRSSNALPIATSLPTNCQSQSQAC